MNYVARLFMLMLCCCAFFGAAAQQVDSSFTLPNSQLPFLSQADSSVIMIADINITGNKKTKPYIIEREIPFKQGDYLTKKELIQKLQLGKQQVMNTSLFVEVAIFISEQHGDMLFINVDVKERWYLFPIPYFSLIDRNFNQWWVEQKRDFNRTNYGIKFMQENFSGRNDQLQVWLINGYSRQLSLRYRQPFSDKTLKHGFEVSTSFSMQRELNFKSDINKQIFFKDESQFSRKNFHADIAYLYRPAIKARHNFRLGYSYESIADTIASLNPKYFGDGRKMVSYPELGYSVDYYDVDYIPYPSRGFTGGLSFVKKGFTSSMNTWSFHGWGTYTFPLSKKTFIYLQSVFSLTLPLDQPYINRRLFGYGDLYLRGMEYYVVDGVAGAMGRITARQQVLKLDVKTPLKSRTYGHLPFTFYLKAYTDGGYAYTKDPGTSILNNRYMHTWGLGLDILTIYDVVFKLEYSFNQLGDRGFFFHSREDF